MNNKKIEKVVILGGGTAGWMTAAGLSKLLGKNFELTLIESDEISTVGVGEATIPPLFSFHKALDISEPEFMKAVKGTFKLGISFENWKNKGEKYIHSFGRTGITAWEEGFQHLWLKGLGKGITAPFGNYCLEHQAAKFEKFTHLPHSQIHYAYHMDAGLYAKFLRSIAETYGTKRIEGKVSSVALSHTNGYIEKITLESGQEVEGDLFVDCSGFRGILIEQALHTGYTDWSHWLPCDSAIAVQTESVSEPVPYTRSIAHEFGWQWRIPLQHRVGNGLVYCSRYCSDENAKKRLLESIEGNLISEPRVIKFRTGQRNLYWNKNCVAIGLSSGFIEPLESTSIHLIQQGIFRLVRLFPLNGINDTTINEYNSDMKFEVDNIRDFIILHYHVTQRDDSEFWRYCKGMNVPASLRHRIDLFRKTGGVFVKGDELFHISSWLQVMIGQGIMPEHYHALANQLSDESLTKLLTEVRTSIDQLVQQMPSHQHYINSYCSASDWDK